MSEISLIGMAFTFFLFIPSILCRTSSQNSPSLSSAVLDVSASIQLTHQVLSTKEHQQQEQDAGVPTSISLSLHPRSSFFNAPHNDYKSLTLSRIARDSARLTSITAKIHFALNNLTHSGLNPVATAVQLEDFQTPVTSGASQGSGEYFARIGVGRPASQFYMVIDTGSDISWLQCQPCSDCYTQADPVFNPSASTTYSPVSCGSPQCSSLHVSSCQVNKCLYQVSYGDGSYTVGDFATETVSFGNSYSAPNVAIGCGHDNEGLFVGAAGILGLGGGSLSLPSQIKATSFSYCLVDRDTDSFTLKYITVENSAGPAGGQAVAMATVSNHSVYYKSVFLGNQDTLYTRSGYQFYRDCDVYGTVDFIYGAAVAVFQNCNLYARTANRYAVFTAQGRDSIQQYSGYTIQNCTLTVSPEPIHSGKTGLIGFMGRPWRNYSTVIVMESWIDDFIDRRGWSEMGDNSVDSLTYREYNNRGPGSNTDRRVKWAGYGVLRSDWEAKPYTADVVIHGDSWIPGMGIPYYGGLISG